MFDHIIGDIILGKLLCKGVIYTLKLFFFFFESHVHTVFFACLGPKLTIIYLNGVTPSFYCSGTSALQSRVYIVVEPNPYNREPLNWLMTWRSYLICNLSFIHQIE